MKVVGTKDVAVTVTMPACGNGDAEAKRMKDRNAIKKLMNESMRSIIWKAQLVSIRRMRPLKSGKVIGMSPSEEKWWSSPRYEIFLGAELGL